MKTMITCVEDLIDDLDGVPHFDKLIFRGQANSDWLIKPALLRRKKSTEVEYLEKMFFMPLSQGIRSPFSKYCDPIELLTYFQHYGIPTRLLDFTLDPFTALFFSCYDKFNQNEDRDGIFLLININTLNKYLLDGIENVEFNKPWEDLDMSMFKEKLYRTDVSFVKPNMNHPRARAQQGVYLMFPFASESTEDVDYIDLISYVKFRNKAIRLMNPQLGPDYFDTGVGYKKIDGRCKKYILNQLDDLYGINPSSVFVESGLNRQMEEDVRGFWEKINTALPSFVEICEQKAKSTQ